MRFVLAIIVLFVLAAPAFCVDLTDDAAFDKPVTLAVKGEAVYDVVLNLKKQTDVKLSVAKNIADRKITVFVDEKPLKDVMNGLETLLGYRWNKKTSGDKVGYELCEDPKTRKAREDHKKKIAENAWKELESQIKLKAELSSKTPEELMKLREEAAKNRKPQERYYMTTADDYELCTSPYYAPLMPFYQSLPRTLLDSLTPDTKIYFDSDSKEAEWKIPQSLVNDLIVAHHSSMKKLSEYRSERGIAPFPSTIYAKPTGVNIKLVYTSVPGMISLKAEILFRLPSATQQPYNYSFSNNDSNITFGRDGLFQSTDIWLGSVSFGDELWKSGGELPVDTDNSTLGKKVSLSTADIMDGLTEYERAIVSVSKKVNRSDVLAALHRKLGLQIMADHYSIWFPIGDFNNSTVSELITSLKGDRGFQSYTGADDQFLYVLSMYYGDLDEREIPNRILWPWQKTFAEKGCLGFDEMAGIATLNSQQLMSLYYYGVDFGLGEMASFGSDDYWMLRLYGLLSSKQCNEIFSSGTAVGAFTPEQRYALDRLLNRGRIDEEVEDPVAVRVGIYRDRTRIDKPEPRSETGFEPVLVAISRSNDVDTFDYEVRQLQDDGRTHGSFGSVEAKTKEEAIRRIQNENPNATLHDLKHRRNLNYRVTVKYANGESTDIDVPIRTPVQYKNN